MSTKPIWADQREGRVFYRIPVTTTLVGDLSLPLHVVQGRSDGPTFAITATIHGDETVPAMMIRQLLNELDPAELSGRVCAMPVCNPISLAAFSRQTPEQHGATDLHEVFPGNAKGNLTQMLAHTIATNLLDHVDLLIDYHCGGSGGRLQSRVDVNAAATQALQATNLAHARNFGTIVIHENRIPNSAVGYANDKGIMAFGAETSGVFLSSEHQSAYMAAGVEGFRNVMRGLGMLPEKVTAPPRQICFPGSARREVNPSRGGYLLSNFQQPSELGKPVAKGTLLGQLIDMHTLEVVEELIAPIDGHLFFSRYSGVVDAGTKAFALADDAGSKWIE